jgi:hypothetical protein
MKPEIEYLKIWDDLLRWNVDWEANFFETTHLEPMDPYPSEE